MLQSNAFFQKIAFNLAFNNLGLTYPNPSVAALLVKDGRIISRAVTSKNGGSHAEFLALENCKIKDLANVDMYVTLEPCSHIGKNPACAKLIIDSGIKRVFYSYLDPNPLVNGKGIKLLMENGIECIHLPVYQDEFEGFSPLRYDRTKILVSLKSASSLDMKMALKNGDSKWITNEASRKYGQYLRRINDITLTGIGTVLADDPLFNCRIDSQKDSHLAILDSNLNIPINAKLFAPNLHKKVIIFYDAALQNEAKLAALNIFSNIELVPILKHNAGLSLKDVMSFLLKREYFSILVEAGPCLSASFIEAGLVDLYYIFTGHKLLGAEAKNSFEISSPEKLINCSNLSLIDVKTFGEDVLRVLALKSLFKE